MGKKRFDKTTKRRKKLTREDDGALRVTHLWAAAHLLAEGAPSLSRHYVSTTRQICRRINLKTDFITIKRQLCKRCDTLLIPGLGGTGSRVRHVTTPQRHVRVVCGRCGGGRRYLSRGGGAGGTRVGPGGEGAVGAVTPGDAGAVERAESCRERWGAGVVKRRSCSLQ